MSETKDERTKEELLGIIKGLETENRRLNDVIHNLRVGLTELTDRKSKLEIIAIKQFVAIRECLAISREALESSFANQGCNKDVDKSFLLPMIDRSLKNLPPDI